LRLVARYADACNLFPTPDIPRKLEVLRGHCDAVGRDYAAIEKTAVYQLNVGPDGEDVDEAIGGLHWLAGMGIQTVHAAVRNVETITPLEVIAERVLPAVANL
jgi:hypothetical protein